MFLLSRFRGANLRWMADLTFDSQLSRQVQKPVHRSGRFQAHAHRARKFRIKLPHAVTFVEQSCIHDLPGGGIQHRQRLLASVQIASYNSHSASFGPSAVRVNTETVYSGRSEADLVMASIGKVEIAQNHISGNPTNQALECPKADRSCGIVLYFHQSELHQP